MRKAASTLIAVVLALLSIGIVMLASTSSVKGQASFGDPYYFLKRQLIWMAIAFVVGIVVIRFDYHWWFKVATPLFVGSLLLLTLVLIPHIGVEVKGSFRWIRLGPLTLQPSEVAKFSSIVALCAWMSHAGRRARRLKEGLIIPLLGLGGVLCLVILEPDFGTTLLIGMVSMIIMFAGGTRMSYLSIAGTLGLSVFALAVMQNDVRMGRILAFLMPEKYPDVGYHLAQSKIAFVNGGLFGVGLGNSMQKQLYLPEAHTDFIFAIVGEELGFFATGLIVVLYLAFLICGLAVSVRAPDPFGKLLAFGLTISMVVQASINIGVVTGCLPTKGIALPFISYGGSSLIMSIACTAVIVNIAIHCSRASRDRHTRVIKDSAHRF